jgi:hypothetical protein
MGKPIVYCEGCGRSLREEEFARGRAAWVDGRPVCGECRGASPEPGPAARAGPRRSAALPRRPAPPGLSARPFLIAGAVGVGVLLLILVTVALGGKRPEPARTDAPGPGPDPAAEAAAGLEALASGGADPEEILLACDRARPALRGTRHEARLKAVEAQALERRARSQRDQAAKLDGFLRDVRNVAAEDPGFARRLEVLGMLDTARKIAGPRAGEVDRIRSEYEGAFDGAARRLAEATRAEVERLTSRKKYEDALAKLDAFPGAFAATAHAAPLGPLRREVAAKVEALARLRARPRHEASHVWKHDTVEALSDGRLPQASGDTSIPRFTWWDRRGTTEWVSWNFEEPRTVSACEVYWFDDTGAGSCRVPDSWRLYYLDGETWREVRGGAGFGVERDRFNRATFTPVETASLKLEVLLRADVSGGILEWRLE